MKKFILISPKKRTLNNFRDDLIKVIIAKGNDVIMTCQDRVKVDKIKTQLAQ